MAVLFLTFCGNSTFFSLMIAPIYNPTSNARGPFFPACLPSLVICYLFDDRHWDKDEMVFVMALICIFLILVILSICQLAVCIFSLEKCLFRFSPHFLIRLFLWYWLVWAFYTFWILTSDHIYLLQLSSPIHKVAFLFCWWFPCLCKAFKFD